MAMKVILYHTTSELGTKPSASNLEYGELAINDYSGNETIFIKDNGNTVREIKIREYTDMLKPVFTANNTAVRSAFTEIETRLDSIVTSTNSLTIEEEE